MCVATPSENVAVCVSCLCIAVDRTPKKGGPKVGSGVGSGWDPVGSGVKKWDPGGFRGVVFRRKGWDPIPPASGF